MDKLELSFITINIWGIFISLGFILAIILALDAAKRENIKSWHIWNIAIISIICGIAGSRLLYAMENWREFSGKIWLIFDLINKTGLSFFGGFALAAGGIYLYTKNYVGNNIYEGRHPLSHHASPKRGYATARSSNGQSKAQPLHFMDLLSIPLLAGMAAGRAGCFMAHDHLPLGRSVWLDPALYLMLANFALFLIFLMFRDRIKKQGALTALFLIGISASRFFTDYLRAEPKYFGLLAGQWMAIFLLALLSLILIKSSKFKVQSSNKIKN